MVTDGKNTEYYQELKACFTEAEWQSQREIVFQSYSSLALVDLYCKEMLYDRLWGILKDHSINTVMGYEDVLLLAYKDEMLEKYAFELNRMATVARDRETYRYWVRVLRRMKEMGGKNLVDAIAADWRIRYKNRRAMMDELRIL